MRIESLLIAAAILSFTAAQSEAQTDSPDDVRSGTADRLTLALTTTPDPVALRDAARVAAARLPEGSRAADRLARLARSGADRASLRRSLERVRDDLAFAPVREAALPVGFPEPAPVGEIVLKDYPGYRLARASTMVGETGAFFMLFAHIKSNDIPMTAPVEMSYSGSGDQRAMAFLYGDPGTGRPGRRGLVNVVDVEPMKTVTLGMRGRRNDRVIEAARRTLEQWVAGRDDLEIAGDMRVMGYNSPSVPGSRQFYEVEFPVRDVTPQRVLGRSL